MAQLFTNNAVSTLAAGITNVATSLTVATGHGAKFPAPTAADFFYITLTQPGLETSWEIVKCTARTGDVLTIVRAQEGTAAAAWVQFDKVELRLTAGTTGDFLLDNRTLTSNQGGAYMRHYRNVADYTGPSADTGTIKITLPNSWTSTMMQLKLSWYDYTTQGAFELIIGGYDYIGPTAGWLATTSARCNSDLITSVRFGHDGTKCCILIGTLASVWQYPKIVLTDLITGYIGSNWDSVIQNTTITKITSEVGITVTATPTVLRLGSAAYTDSTAYAASAHDHAGLLTRTEIPTAVDLNTYTTTGIYHQDANADALAGTNYPVAKAGMLTVFTNTMGNSSHTYQTYYVYDSATKYTRNKYLTTWTAWTKIYTAANNGDISGNADGASRTVGTTAQDANVIANTRNGITNLIYSAGSANYPTSTGVGIMARREAMGASSLGTFQIVSDTTATAALYTRKVTSFTTVDVWSAWDKIYTAANNGDISGNAATVTLTADNSTNATNYPLFVNAATGNLSPRTDTGFTYNPSTGLLLSNLLQASGAGSVSSNVDTTDNTINSYAGTIQSAFTNTNTYLLTHAPARTVARFGLTLGGWTEISSLGTSSLGMVVGTQTAMPLVFGTNNAERARFDSNGHFYPNANTQTLGSASKYWGTTYTTGVVSSGNVGGLSSNIQNEYSQYAFRLGGSTDLGWKLLATVVQGTAVYSATSFYIDVVNTQGNHGNNLHAHYTLPYRVTCYRSGGTLDNINAAYISGPVNEYIRVSKTSTGNYEIQGRTPSNYVFIDIKIRVQYSLDGTVTYSTGAVAGDTLGTMYTASVTQGTHYFTNISSSNDIYALNTITASGPVISKPTTTTHGYAKLEPGSATVSGYVSFWSFTGGVQQGYIGNSSTNLGENLGTIDYGAGLHSFITGNVAIATKTPKTTQSSGAVASLSVEKAAGYSAISAYAYSTTAAQSGILILGRSKSATQGTLAATADLDALGYIAFEGVNSSSALTGAAYVKGTQDGAAGVTYIPGKLEFSTGTSAAAPVNRLTLDSAGNLWPTTTNTYTLGSATKLWSNVYATTFTGALSGTASLATSIAGKTQWGVLYQSAVGTTASTAAGAAKAVLVGNGAAAPTFTTIDLTYLPDAAFKKSVVAASTADIDASTRTATVLTGYSASVALNLTTTLSSATVTTTSTAGIKVGATVTGNANIPNLTTTATATTVTTNYITVTSTTGIVVGSPIVFTGTAFGNLVSGTTYYVITVVNATTLVVSATYGGTAFVLATASGTLSASVTPTVVSITNATTFVLNNATGILAGTAVASTITNFISAITMDGITLAATNRVLLKNQSLVGGVAVTANRDNGIYEVTTLGDVATAWVLTRVTDMDSASEAAGAIVNVDSGTVNGGNIFKTMFLSTSAWPSANTWYDIIDSSGATFQGAVSLLVGGTVAAQNSWIANQASQLAIERSAGNSTISTRAYSSSASQAGILALGRSKSATQGTLAATADGDALGYISFEGVNSSLAIYGGAYIKGTQDGAVGATYIPGKLEFFTGTSAAAPTNKLTLDNAGNLWPTTTNTYTLGSATKLWSNIYSTDLTISGNTTLGNAATDTITLTGSVNSNLTFLESVAPTISVADRTTAANGSIVTINAGRGFANSTTVTAYAGGALALIGGPGGANSFTGGTGGAGGALTLSGATGGVGSGATTATGGAGGQVNISGGLGSSGTSQGGGGGIITITGGSVGAGGTNTNAGSVYINAGIAAGTGTSAIYIGNDTTTGRNKTIDIGNATTTTYLTLRAITTTTSGNTVLGSTGTSTITFTGTVNSNITFIESSPLNIVVAGRTSAATGTSFNILSGAGFNNTTTTTAYNGGTLSITGGSGGTNSVASGTSGNGGNTYVYGGAAGTASGTTSTGGAGGSSIVWGGAGGSGTTLGGTGGAGYTKGGAGGSSTVSGGSGGTAFLQGGAGGSGGTTGGTGGYVYITGGYSGAGGTNVNAGGIMIDTGVAIGTGQATISIGTASTVGQNKVINIGHSATVITTSGQTVITGLSTNISTKTAAYTALLTDTIILCDATTASFSVTLPAASTASGKMYTIKKIDATANTITIDANAAETIDGAATKVISAQYASLTIVCNGTAWFII